MDENSLRKHLNRLTVVVGAISIALLAAGSIASHYLRNILDDTFVSQMEGDTLESVSESIYQLMTYIRIVTVVVLFVLLIIIIYGYRMIYTSNRRLIKSVYYDPLTGAYNMPRFEHKISKIIETTQRYSLVAVNVRQFKFINEIFGNRQADMLLCHIKEVIENNVLENEYFCRSSEENRCRKRSPRSWTCLWSVCVRS